VHENVCQCYWGGYQESVCLEEGAEKNDAIVGRFFHHAELGGAGGALDIHETMANEGVPAICGLGEVAERAEEKGVDEELVDEEKAPV